MLWGGSFQPSPWQRLREQSQQMVHNRLLLNCFRMGESDLRTMHEELTAFRPAGLLGYASALVELAQYLRRCGLKSAYPTNAVISAAETLDPTARVLIQDAFGVPVFNRYGSREMGLIAMECSRHGGLHIDCENVHVELIDDPEGSGLQRIIVTRLNQFSMPFIRYDIGDLADGPVSMCECGRGYPVLRKVVGRVTEMIRFPTGGTVPGEIFPHLFKGCGIASFRVVQSEDYSINIALVRLSSQTPEQDRMIRQIITQHVPSSVPVAIRYVDSLDRSRAGKLLPVISRAPRPIQPSRSGP
jgi:phenylacetate-CoA ligase